LSQNKGAHPALDRPRASARLSFALTNPPPPFSFLPIIGGCPDPTDNLPARQVVWQLSRLAGILVFGFPQVFSQKTLDTHARLA
jgi:hypothetical protein